MKKSFENQAEIMPDSEVNKETKEAEIKPEEFLNELSRILTAMESARIESDSQIKKMIREEAGKLGIDIVEEEMKEIIDDQQGEFNKEVKSLKKKFLKNIAPYVLLILMAFSYWRGSGKEIPFTERHIAQAQIMEKGITDSQRRRAYIPGVSELLEKGITPYDYDMKIAAEEFVPNLLIGKKESYKKRTLYAESDIHQRDDAWRLYLGLPQRYNTFGVSNYRPQSSFQDKCYYKINNFFLNKAIGYDGEQEGDIIRTLVTQIRNYKTDDYGVAGEYMIGLNDVIMRQYKLSIGQDTKGYYISYYDVWDLSEMGGKLVGKPFEIYDRIYYNPETYKVIDPQSK